MFWIGAAGVAVALLAVVVGISAIGWSVGKERTVAAAQTKELHDYWRHIIQLTQEKNELMEKLVMEKLVTELRCIAKK